MKICLETGEAQAPDTGLAHTFEVRTTNDIVNVVLPRL